MPGAGALDRYLTIQAVTETRSGPDLVQVWTDVATVRAAKRDASGRERFTAQQRLAEHATVFTIRYRDDVTPKHRGICDGRIWDFQGIAEIGRRQWLEITAESQMTVEEAAGAQN